MRECVRMRASTRKRDRNPTVDKVSMHDPHFCGHPENNHFKRTTSAMDEEKCRPYTATPQSYMARKGGEEEFVLRRASN